VRTAKIANAVKLTPVKPANAVKPVLATPASASPVPVILTRQSAEKNILVYMQALAPAGDLLSLLSRKEGKRNQARTPASWSGFVSSTANATTRQ
ncbi:MAG: hypothetical protein WBP23_06060, partial [Candidatus Saccharimonadales bacterium]